MKYSKPTRLSFHIYDFMHRLELSGNELMIYAIIYSFTSSPSGLFYGSKETLASTICACDRTVYRALKKLKAKGYIEERIIDGIKGLCCTERFMEKIEPKAKAPRSCEEEKTVCPKPDFSKYREPSLDRCDTESEESEDQPRKFIPDSVVYIAESRVNHKYKPLSFGRKGIVSLTEEQYKKLHDLLPNDNLHYYIRRFEKMIEEKTELRSRPHSHYKILRKWIEEDYSV